MEDRKAMETRDIKGLDIKQLEEVDGGNISKQCRCARCGAPVTVSMSIQQRGLCRNCYCK